LAKCSGITQAGTACRGIPIDGSQYCYAHHPDHRDERRRHGARGGKRGGRGRPRAELADLKTEVRTVIDQVRDGGLDKGVGAVLAQLYNVLLKAVSVGLDVEERQELLQRLEALEADLEASRRSKGYA
jgi:hypothetical protein